MDELIEAINVVKAYCNRTMCDECGLFSEHHDTCLFTATDEPHRWQVEKPKVIRLVK